MNGLCDSIESNSNQVRANNNEINNHHKLNK